MPHPERAVESALGSSDGLVIFRSMVEALVGDKAVTWDLRGIVNSFARA
jgi:hypothetical protein